MAVDSWDLLDGVDVLGPWGLENAKHLVSPKWQERKASLEVLLSSLKKNPKLDDSIAYDEIVISLKKILMSDSNINVVQVALEVITYLALGLRMSFSPHVSKLIGNVFDKTKEKKQSIHDAVAMALDSIAATTTPERIESSVLEHICKPSPLSKIAIADFLYRYFITLADTPLPFMKSILPHVVKLTGDADVKVREACCVCLGSAKRLLGDSITVFIQSITNDKGKMDKIESSFQKSKEERAAQRNGQQESQPNCDSRLLGDSSDEIIHRLEDSSVMKIDPWDMKDPVDLVALLATNFSDLLTSKKWQERKEAVDNLEKLLESMPRLIFTDSISELIELLLKAMEKDVNVNVASGCAHCLAGIVYGLRNDFPHKYCIKATTVAFEKLKDRKEAFRKELNALVDAISLTFHIDIYMESVLVGMCNKNPQSRCQTCSFVKRLLTNMDSNTLPIAATKNLKDVILKCANDADSDVRDAALGCVSAVWKAVGEQFCSTIFAELMEDKIRAEKIKSNVDILKKEPGSLISCEIMRVYKKIPTSEVPAPKAAVSNNTAPNSGPAKSAARQSTAAPARAPIVVKRQPVRRSSASSTRDPIVVRRPSLQQSSATSVRAPIVKAPLSSRAVATANRLDSNKPVGFANGKADSSKPNEDRRSELVRSVPPRDARKVASAAPRIAQPPRVFSKTVNQKAAPSPNVSIVAQKCPAQVSESRSIVPSLGPPSLKPRPDSARFGFRPTSRPSSRVGSRASSPVNKQ